MPVRVKICGLMDATAVAAAVAHGAAFLGFLFTRSRREVTPEQAAALCEAVPASVARVGLFVDPSDDDVARVCATVPLTHLQLHGLETPQRVAALRARTKRSLIKAVSIAKAEDFSRVAAFEAVADYILFDTKTGSAPAGGTGQCFDWSLLTGRTWSKPWFLAGGLTPANAAQAVQETGARLLDVSSGVETDGSKDPAKIAAFLDAANRL